MIRHLAAALLATATLAPAAHAATTVIASGTRGVNIGTSGLGAVGPIGQSFVADDTGLSSFGFQFTVSNASQAVASVTFQLLSGAGLGGPVIATRSLSPTVAGGRTSPPTWVDFDLTGTALTIGQSYTAVLSSATTRLGVIFGPNLNGSGTPLTADAYAAGSLYSGQSFDTTCSTGACDAAFRFTTAALTGAVPEPATWMMLFAGLFVTGAAVRRRSSTAAVCRADVTSSM